MKSDEIIARLSRALGEGCTQMPDGSRFTLKGEDVHPVVFPGNPDQLREVMAMASAEQWSVIPAGAGSWLEMGNPPSGFDLVVSTSRMARIVEYEPADLTATIEAGCTLTTFNANAAQHRQFIPLDPFGDEDSTIGAIIATSSYGPLRCAYGSPRDWVVGMTIIHADGRITKAGGKVVKNVAGYDLCKLYTGSFGTLGIIVEMSFKLRALPASDRTFIIYSDNAASLCKLVERITDSDLSPSSIELLSPQDSGLPVDKSKFVLALRFLNEPETTAWQLSETSMLAADHQHLALSDKEAADFWKQYLESEITSDWDSILRISVLPSDLATKIYDIDRLFPESMWRTHAANGVIRVFLRHSISDYPADSEVCASIAVLRQRAQSRGGSLTILRPGDLIKGKIDVWGGVGPTASLMKEIKEKFDPNSLLNRGRFVTGI